MPIYEYECSNCGVRIEKLQRITADPLVHCEACGKDGLKRLVSQTSFVLKGSGWYVTDYKNKSMPDKPSSNQSSSSDSSDSSSSSESKTTSSSSSSSD